MRVRVLFFGVLREAVSQGEQVLDLEAPATAASVLAHYRNAVPGVGALWNAVAVAVNQQYVSLGATLAEGDEVALLPPVSGGSGDDQGTDAAPARAFLTRARIETAVVIEGIKTGGDGAVVVFDGIVRNNTRGRQTRYLEYQGYEGMALEQMRALAAEALGRFPVHEAVLVHRLGRLEIGESSVLIVVASAHRAAAFEACRWLIDTLKKTVPIWKKEYFVDGAVWADGEPFPEEIVPGGARQ